MNDEAVVELWKALGALEIRISDLEMSLGRIDAHIRARLKEEAERAKYQPLSQDPRTRGEVRLNRD